jgi:hypothetical protein
VRCGISFTGCCFLVFQEFSQQVLPQVLTGYHSHPDVVTFAADWLEKKPTHRG